MNTKLIIVTLLAFAAGGTCPSDVNNDGTVGITDFLQLLGDWGPCPSPKLVDVDDSADGWLIRLWSDNTVEVGRFGDSPPCWQTCAESLPATGQWLVIDSPPQPVGASPVAVTVRTGAVGYVHYSDGATFQRGFGFFMVEPCAADRNLSHHCEFEWQEEAWTEFAGGTP